MRWMKWNCGIGTLLIALLACAIVTHARLEAWPHAERTLRAVVARAAQGVDLAVERRRKQKGDTQPAFRHR